MAATDSWATLPPGSYCNDELFALETDRIFRAGWLNVGHVSLVARPGDFRCVDVADELLVLTRDRTGELHVLSRVCAHRWMEVCVGEGRSSALQCPYHHWTYSLSGELKSAPLMSGMPGFAKQAASLREFRHEVWNGFVYVNIDGTAPSTSRLWSPLEEQLASYRLDDWRVVSTIDWGECPWDWKVFMDNGECYHHLGIHQRTLEPLFPTRAIRHIRGNGLCSCIIAPASITRADHSPRKRSLAAISFRLPLDLFPRLLSRVLPRAAQLALPRLNRDVLARLVSAAGVDTPVPGLTDEQLTSLTLAYPFPNYALAVLPDSCFWYEVHPVAAGRIRLKTHLLLPPHLAHAAGLVGRVARHETYLRVVHEEDIAVCTSVQRGLRSRSSQEGMLSTYEQHNKTFARWYADGVTRPHVPVER